MARPVPKSTTKTCVVCGKTALIRPSGAVSKFCSEECKKVGDVIDLTCKVCGKTFKGNKREKCCSPVCKKKNEENNNKLFHLKRLKQYVEENGATLEECPKCKLCGNVYASITNDHVTSEHGIHIRKYKELFNLEEKDLHVGFVFKEKQERVIGEKNPGYNHGGRLSPVSKKFVKYQNLDEDAAQEMIDDVISKISNKRDENDSYTCRTSYYTKRGMTEEEAEKARTLRQTTFSKEICIEKYGVEEGTRIWKERQEKWQQSLDNLSDEQKMIIRSRKGHIIENYRIKYGDKAEENYTRWRKNVAAALEELIQRGYSKISKELFTAIDNIIGDRYKCLYAENEKRIETNRTHRYLDFYIEELNLAIEFLGEYWHQDESKDFSRDLEIREAFPNIDILYVGEMDYKRNKEEVLERCLLFLTPSLELPGMSMI